MKQHAVITLIFLFLSVTAGRSAESRQFIHINTSNSALSSDCVKAIFQDSRGYIWIGTAKGVNRYDGTSIRVYGKYELGLESDFVSCIGEDPAGNVWVATSAGACRYDFESDHFYPLECSESKWSKIDSQVNTIVSDPRGYMWFSVNDRGVFKYSTTTGEVSNSPLTFRRFAIDGSGRFWVTSYYKNLFVADLSGMGMIPVNLGSDSDYFVGDQIQMLEFSKSRPELLYVASLLRGLSIVDTKAGSVRNLCSFPRDANLISAFLEGEDRWWAATSEGVFCYDFRSGILGQMVHGEDPFSISDNYANSVLIDREGGLWIGTKDGGVDYSSPYHDRIRKVYEAADGGETLKGAIISGFAESRDGTVWVTTEQKGLWTYRDGRLARVRADGLPKTLTSAVVDGDYLWIGSITGMYRFDTGTKAVKSYGPLPTYDQLYDPRVYFVTRLSSGEIYATTTRGISGYDSIRDIFTPLSSAEARFYTGMVESSSGQIWLSSFYDGVFEMDPNAVEIVSAYSEDDGLGDNRVCSIMEARDGTIWAIGFSLGFSRFDRRDGLFESVNSMNHPALDSDIFYSAVEDDSDRMWLASGKGLVVYTPQTDVVNVLHLSDGLLDEKFTKSAFKSSSGLLFFGSDNGFIVVDPASDEFKEAGSDMAITEMRIGNERVVPGEGSLISSNIDISHSIRLAPFQNTFAFSFSTPGYYANGMKSSQYKLDGYSPDWEPVPAGGEVVFYNIPSGEYTLQLRTGNASGDFVQSHTPLRIEIRKRFIETVWGQAVTVLSILLLVAVAVLLANRASEKKRRKEEAEYRKKKEEEMFYEKMNFFSHVVHEIKTPLTLIRTPLGDVLDRKNLDEDVQHDLNVVRNNTEYLSDLVNELLEFVRVEKKGYTLNPEPIDIVERVSFLLFNYADTAREKNIIVTFEHTQDELWVSADSSAINKILNNLLLNAVKYAKSWIRITAFSDAGGSRLLFSVSNDGPGIPSKFREEIFKPFIRHNDLGIGFGIGLPLARSLAEMQSGSLDLKDGQETCFELSLPLIPDSSTKEASASMEGNQSGKPLVLVVDDNADICDYLSRKLSDAYDIITAESAEKALPLLHEKNVGLMMTDITMSGMNGLDMCRVIRSDIEISHLPIIVLSARSSVESKIQAMEAGADLYVEKPFDMEYLRVSLGNILERRDLMKKAIRGASVETDIKLFGLPARDEEFFRKFDRVITDNISSSDISNAYLASELAVSEATLIRKIRKMLDTTPMDYVRTKRLKMAAARIREGESNLTGLAYDMGFSSLAYFSKCFKDYFGCAPSEYKVAS